VRVRKEVWILFYIFLLSWEWKEIERFGGLRVAEYVYIFFFE
jgi:hypothetical protein